MIDFYFITTDTNIKICHEKITEDTPANFYLDCNSIPDLKIFARLSDAVKYIENDLYKFKTALQSNTGLAVCQGLFRQTDCLQTINSVFKGEGKRIPVIIYTITYIKHIN